MSEQDEWTPETKRVFKVLVSWFDDDEDWVDIEALSFKKACRQAYDHWVQTGWTDITVTDPDTKRSRSFVLDGPFPGPGYPNARAAALRG